MGVIVCLVAIIGVVAGYFKWIHSYWKRRGIEGPVGLPFIGSFYDLADREKPRGFIINKWTKMFGKVFGYYEGVIPVLVVSDLDMLQEMFIKKFDCFYARKTTNLIHGNLECSQEEPRVNLFAARGARWKRLRALASPAFSVKALKQIHETMEDSVFSMVDHMSKQVNGEAFNIHEYYQEFTYDVISRLAMGQTYSEQFNNEGVDIVKKIFLRKNRVYPWYLAVMFPGFENTIKNTFFNHEAVRGGDVGKLLKFCETAVHDRLKERADNVEQGIENPHNDFIDMFLDYYTDTNIEDNAFGIKVEKKVTSEDVIGACFVFLLAGFDTTANTLAYASYLLAKHPQEMRKVQDEIDRICTSEHISYDDIGKLRYMDAVIREALRMYPVAWFACSRECVQATTLGNYYIEKGVRIEADVRALHYSEEIWGKNANEFVPERWLESSPRHNMSWIPFGAGPRQCVGMRLGLSEAKTALAHLLRRFSILAGPKTEKELHLQGCTTTSPEKVTVHLMTRD
ncbi:Cytochrome P450 [Caenorhabditis elegans]|uniref:Cytochrome P450 n=1 Tax=Caenorhabditis elegans TaxID=6239 RepID=Q9XUT8_CAEEL|nr:Cytochrome P450 [Caenorhabditis elegans]CAB04582.3 Cytochrome P450 [Caenorhabditis elegans]|eukprot:NP_510369.2 CYtochrome P450 family [Caenorhabditis elegans]